VSLLLETTGSSREDDASRATVRTPPGASREIPAEPPVEVRGDLFVDVSCAQSIIQRFARESGEFRIVTINLAEHLPARVASRLGRATAIVMGPVLANGLTAMEVTAQLRPMIPHVGLYVVAREAGEVAPTLPKLAAAGVDEVFCLETKADMEAFGDTLRARLSAPAPETEIRLLWKWFRDSSERSLVMHCVRNGFRLDVWSIRSKVFSACRKTLQNRVSLLGLPSPGILSRCGRVLHAQELERRGVKPTTVVAAILGFPSAGAMQRSRRRLRKALMSRGRQAVVFASLLK
jgi:hypothetical protein